MMLIVNDSFCRSTVPVFPYALSKKSENRILSSPYPRPAHIHHQIIIGRWYAARNNWIKSDLVEKRNRNKS